MKKIQILSIFGWAFWFVHLVDSVKRLYGRLVWSVGVRNWDDETVEGTVTYKRQKAADTISRQTHETINTVNLMKDRGLSNREIANQLHISENTVRAILA